MKTLYTILFCLVALAAQAQTWPIHVLVTGDSVPCYVSSCGCEKAYRHVVPPFNGELRIEQTMPDSISVILVRGSFVCMDTCLKMPGTGIGRRIGWNSPDTVTVFICGTDSAQIHIWEEPVTAGLVVPALPAPFVNLDTICAPLVSIQDPQPLAPLPIIDIVTGQVVTAPQPNRVYLQGRRKFVIFAP